MTIYGASDGNQENCFYNPATLYNGDSSDPTVPPYSNTYYTLRNGRAQTITGIGATCADDFVDSDQLVLTVVINGEVTGVSVVLSAGDNNKTTNGFSQPLPANTVMSVLMTGAAANYISTCAWSIDLN